MTRILELAFGLIVAVSVGARAEQCREDTVQIRGDWGQARFSIEIADDNEERAQGLMFRESMPTSAGMLFIYERPQALSFWMRNTLIPLDLLFFDASGTLQRIHAEAKPLDETPIDGGPNLTHVLEINGGLAARLGITEGSVLQHPSFDPDVAAWPC